MHGFFLRFSFLGFALVIFSVACGGDDDGVTPDGGGDADAGGCPAGQAFFEPGCDGPGGQAIAAGCYQRCLDATDGSCPAGTLCLPANVNPCPCPPGSEVCCGACGSTEWLCLVPPSPPEPYSLPSLEATCEGTVSGQDVLDAVATMYAGTFTYADTTTTPLAVGVRYEMGEITCHPQIDNPVGGAPNVPAHVSLEMRMDFETDDGAFAETFPALLDLSAASGVTSLTARVAEGDLAGSYMPTLVGATDVAIELVGDFSPAEMSGSLTVRGRVGDMEMSSPVGSFSVSAM